jgi:hypothetical protein
VAGGPLLPGRQEFDRPRRGWPAWLTWVVASVAVGTVLVVLAGFAGGVGPLRMLGSSTVALDAVGYRLTDEPTAIEVAFTLPADGLCRDDVVDAVAFERGNRVEVDLAVVRSRGGDCALTSLGGDVRWVTLTLDAPLGSRTVIRTVDREPVPQRT